MARAERRRMSESLFLDSPDNDAIYLIFLSNDQSTSCLSCWQPPETVRDFITQHCVIEPICLSREFFSCLSERIRLTCVTVYFVVVWLDTRHLCDSIFRSWMVQLYISSVIVLNAGVIMICHACCFIYFMLGWQNISRWSNNDTWCLKGELFHTRVTEAFMLMYWTTWFLCDENIWLYY